MSLTQRPLAVTIIAWTAMAGGIVGFAAAPFVLPMAPAPNSQNSYGRNEEAAAEIAQMLASTWWLGLLEVAFIAGVFMLKGKKWSRWVMLGTLLAAAVGHAIQRGDDFVVLAELLATVVVGLIIFRTTASAYFATRPVET